MLPPPPRSDHPPAPDLRLRGHRPPLHLPPGLPPTHHSQHALRRGAQPAHRLLSGIGGAGSGAGHPQIPPPHSETDRCPTLGKLPPPPRPDLLLPVGYEGPQIHESCRGPPQKHTHTPPPKIQDCPAPQNPQLRPPRPPNLKLPRQSRLDVPLIPIRRPANPTSTFRPSPPRQIPRVLQRRPRPGCVPKAPPPSQINPPLSFSLPRATPGGRCRVTGPSKASCRGGCKPAPCPGARGSTPASATTWVGSRTP